MQLLALASDGVTFSLLFSLPTTARLRRVKKVAEEVISIKLKAASECYILPLLDSLALTSP